MIMEKSKVMGDYVVKLFGVTKHFLHFLMAFSLFFVLVICVTKILYQDIASDLGKSRHADDNLFWVGFLDMISVMNSNFYFVFYTLPFGAIFVITVFIVVNILFLALKAAYLINKTKEQSRNINAFKNFKTIQFKNTNSYDD